MEQSTIRKAGIAGVVWAATTAGVGLAVGSPPALDAPADELRAYFLDNRGAYLAAAAVLALTLPLFFAFVGTLAARVRGEGSGDPVPLVITGAASGAMVLTAVTYVLTLPLAFDRSLGEAASGDLLQVLYVGTFLLTMFANAALATALLAIGVAGARSGLPAWLTTAALVLGGVELVASAGGLVSADVAVAAGAAFFLTSVWVIAAGVVMARSSTVAVAPVRTLAA